MFRCFADRGGDFDCSAAIKSDAATVIALKIVWWGRSLCARQSRNECKRRVHPHNESIFNIKYKTTTFISAAFINADYVYFQAKNKVGINPDLVTRTRIELVLPPWKGGVLTSWPPGHMVAAVGFEPTTNRVWTEYSSQLSYAAICVSLLLFPSDLLII